MQAKLLITCLLFTALVSAFSWQNVYSGGNGFTGGYAKPNPIQENIVKPVFVGDNPTILDLPKADFLDKPGYVEIKGNQWSYYVPLEEAG